MLLETAVHVEEEDTLFFEVLADGVVNRFGFVLSGDSAQPLLLRFGDSKSVKRVFDVVRNIVPIFLRSVRRAKEVGHVVEINVVEFAAITPVWHLAFHEVMVGFDTNLRHPFGFILEGRNVPDHLLREAFVKSNGGVFRVVEPEFVIAHCLTCFIAHVQASLGASSHS